MRTETEALDVQDGSFNKLFESSAFHFVLVALLAAASLFGFLHRGDLSGYDDAAYAHEGKEILRNGTWLEVRLNGYLDFDKPPLFVWCEAISMKVLGVSDFAAKFPTAVFGLGTIVLVFFICRLLTNQFWPPIMAMFIMTTSPPFMKYAMHAMTCVPYTFFFALAMFAYLKGRTQPAYLLLCGVATGLANLTRSPVGWIPLGIIVLHLAGLGRLRQLWSRYMVACFAIALLLPILWYWSQYDRYGSKFVSEHFGNLLNHATFEHKGGAAQFAMGLLKYPFWLLESYWPWLPAVVIGFVMQSKKMLREREFAASLLVIWVVCVLVPFSIASAKVLRYILPAFPAFSIIAALALDAYLSAKAKPLGMKVSYAIVGIMLLVMIPLPNYLVRGQDMRELAPIAEAASAPGDRVVLYNFGQHRWDYLNQLIWYGNRFCETTEDVEAVKSKLAAHAGTVVVMDRQTFERSIARDVSGIEILGQSAKFICFRAAGGAKNAA